MHKDVETRGKLLAAASTAVLLMGACGGGGGNVRQDPPPPVTPPPPNPTCQDPNATNPGGPLPCTYPAPRYNGEPDNLLVPIGADLAHAVGVTGAGVKVGVIDDGKIDGYAPIEGKVAWYQDFTGKEGEIDPSKSRGHGNVISGVIVGTASGTFKGGVAPDAKLYWGRVCYDHACTTDLAERAINALGEQGVRLFNFSLGAYAPDDNEARARRFAVRAAGVLMYDGLFVAGTGNDSAAEASSTAVVPRYTPQFANNWLAVTSVHVDNKGNPTQKPEYANACGLAAAWCLAAPSLVQVPGVAGTAYEGRVDGTSVATAVATGTASLVWQAFPWMSASNVQQTLLTTATDLGEPGVDAVYGWGMINAAKAIKGPGQLIDVFTAKVSGESTFANAISGQGRLVKEGDGLLRLTGANTYTGGTTVSGGTLLLTGALGSNVEVGNTGTFASMAGKINGNYAAAAGATTAIGVGSGLSITGTAELGGTLRLLPPASSSYEIKATESLLTAGKVNGRFANVTYGSGFFWTAALTYSETAVVANMTRTSAASSAITAMASASVVAGGYQADALIGFGDQAVASGQGEFHLGPIALGEKLAFAPTAAAAMDSLASLTGEIHGTARTLGVQRGLNDGALLAERVRGLGVSGESGVWAQVDGVDGRQRRDGYGTADYRQHAFRVGVDSELDTGVTVGASAAKTRSNASLDTLGGSLEGSGTSVAVYGRAALGESAYIAGVVGHDRHTIETRRTVLAGTDLASVAGRHTDTTTLARLEAGILLGQGITPYMAVGALRHAQGAFVEDGADGLGLAASTDTLTATFADIGVRFDRQSGRWVFGGSASGRRVLGGDDTGFDARFAGAPEAGFTVTGQALAKNSLRVGGHLFYRTDRGWVWFLNAGGEQASGQSRNGFGAVGIKIGF